MLGYMLRFGRYNIKAGWWECHSFAVNVVIKQILEETSSFDMMILLNDESEVFKCH